MKSILPVILSFTMIGASWAQPADTANSVTDPLDLRTRLEQKQWIHGSADCKTNTDPSIDVFQYDASSYVLRQNKCSSYEAPFVYVLFGSEKVLILDTGASDSAAEFPLSRTVQSLIARQDGPRGRKLLVVHSHSHSDHTAGDAQFAELANVTLVTPTSEGVRDFFAFDKWPEGRASLDLGGRKLTVIPTPGHQEEAISIYDPQTQWLLTGDTFYPGNVYVKQWRDYRQSIARLAAFAKEHPVSAVLGAHIEISDKAGELYPVGTQYQPNEASLVLLPEDLTALDAALAKAGEPGKIALDKVVVEPMGALAKAIGSVLKWILH